MNAATGKHSVKKMAADIHTGLKARFRNGIISEKIAQEKVSADDRIEK